MLEHQVAVNVDDANRDRNLGIRCLGFYARGQGLGCRKQIHGIDPS
jgi:hypothetical protein